MLLRVRIHDSSVGKHNLKASHRVAAKAIDTCKVRVPTTQQEASNTNKLIPTQGYRGIAARFRRRSFAQGYRAFRRKLKGRKFLTLPRVRKEFMQTVQGLAVQYKKNLSVAVRSAKDRIFSRKYARLARARINRRRHVRAPRNLLVDAGIPAQLFLPTRYDFDLRGGLYSRRSR